MGIADAARRKPAAAGTGARNRRGKPSRLFTWLAGPAGAGCVAAVGLAVTVAVAAGWFDSLNVLHGAPLWVPVGVAAVCMVASTASHTARWWRTWGAGLAAATTILIAVTRWWIRHSGLVLDRYPNRFVVFAWLGVAAVGVAVTGWWTGPAALRAVRLLAAPTSVLAAFLLINSYYGYWPTVASLLNKPVAGQMSKRALAGLLRPARLGSSAIPRTLAAAHQGAGSGGRPAPAARAAPTVPQAPAGHYGPVDIPGTAVGFPAAQAYLWLPPDFAAVSHATLSVMVMLPGWPGTVQDWTRAGRATDIANAWARAHGGHAPVMLFIDENGTADRDTECVNSIEGRAESYLAVSVPLFLERTLGITPDPSRWALVGASEGGTCAITLALRHPGMYGRFVDIAGEPAPSFWGGPTATLRTLYAGNMMAEERHTPGWLFQRHRYPGMVAWFATGNTDDLRASDAQLAVQAARAGIEVQAFESPGGHTWTYARRAFARIYPGLVGYLSGAGVTVTRTT